MTTITTLLIVALMTALFFMPYAVTNILTQGLPRALGNPSADDKPLPAWAKRAKAAHYNAVENLVVFAPIVIAAQMLGATGPATAMAAKVYLIARALHYVVYTLGIPGVRTVAFFAGWGATVFIGLKALGVV